MNRTKEIQNIINLIKIKYSYITLSCEECEILINYINQLEDDLDITKEANDNLTKHIVRLNNEKSFHNARLIATWQQSRLGNIYRKYSLLFNGDIFPVEVYGNNENYMKLNTTPTYLNEDLQFFLRGKSSLSELKEIDYVTFKKCHSGV